MLIESIERRGWADNDVLAEWFHLLSPSAHYADVAKSYRDTIFAASRHRPHTLLELGSGGGNNAFFLKRYFTCTLTDRSPVMLARSRTINPECEHIENDMRTLRLNRQFDVVFIHDAITYLTTEADLRLALETAFVHTRLGGVALFAPDCVRETFQPRTHHGGNDDNEGHSLRYLEWRWDPDPTDMTYLVDFVIMLRESGMNVRVVHDRHVCGLFPRASWIDAIVQTGFRVQSSTKLGFVGEPDEVFIVSRMR